MSPTVRAILGFLGCVLFSVIILWGMTVVLARVPIPPDIGQLFLVIVGLICLCACLYAAYLVFRAFTGGGPPGSQGPL